MAANSTGRFASHARIPYEEAPARKIINLCSLASDIAGPTCAYDTIGRRA